jgi:cytochrome c5
VVSPDWNCRGTRADPTPKEFLAGRSPLELQGLIVVQFMQCRNCHAIDGIGGHRGPDLADVGARLTKDQLVRQVIQSGGNMPAYGKNLTTAQVEAVVAYMVSLRPPGIPPARDSSQPGRPPMEQGSDMPKTAFRRLTLSGAFPKNASALSLPEPEGDPLHAGVILRARCLDVGIVFERVVDDPAVVGIEEVGLDRASGRADGLSEVPDFFDEGVVAHRAVVLDIHDDPCGRRIPRGKDPVHEVLKIVHHDVLASDQPLGLVGEDLQHRVPVALLLLNFHNEPKVSEDRVKDFNRRLVHGFLFFCFLELAASRLATTLFFSSVGSGRFRVR